MRPSERRPPTRGGWLPAVFLSVLVLVRSLMNSVERLPQVFRAARRVERLPQFTARPGPQEAV